METFRSEDNVYIIFHILIRSDVIQYFVRGPHYIFFHILEIYGTLHF